VPIRSSLGGQQACQFVILEADQLETEIFLLQGSEFDAKHVLVSAGIQRQAVVGEDVGRFCVSVRLELSRSEEAAVASDDAGLGINQYRVIEPELGDASGDLSDLGVGVGPGIPGVGYELLDQPVLDPLGHRWGFIETIALFRCL
jgi:hypothetical protein